MDQTRFQKIFKLRQLNQQLEEIETKMKKVAVTLAMTSDIIEQEKDLAIKLKQETVTYQRKLMSMAQQSEQEISDKLLIMNKLDALYKVKEKKLNEVKGKFKTQKISHTVESSHQLDNKPVE